MSISEMSFADLCALKVYMQEKNGDYVDDVIAFEDDPAISNSAKTRRKKSAKQYLDQRLVQLEAIERELDKRTAKIKF